MGDLPPGWVWAKLADLCDVIGGITVDKGRGGPDMVEVPYLRVANVQRGRLDLRTMRHILVPARRLDDLRLVRGDVLLNEGGDRDKVGRGWVWEGQIEPCVFQNHVFRARPRSDAVNPYYLSLYLNECGRAHFLAGAKQTTNLASISLSAVKETPIAVAPRDEQDRIVGAINALFDEVEAGEAALARAREALTTFRASLLHAAVTGQLTEAWRAANPPTEDGPDLLRRILAERRAAWERAELERLSSGKTPPTNEDWKSRYVAPAVPDPTGLPRGWTCLKVQDTGLVQLGRQRAPQYHDGPNMRHYLRVANVFENRIDVTDVMQMEFDASDFAAYRLVKSDILLNEGQSAELVGRPAMFCDEIADCCFTNTLVRYRAGPAVLPAFALLVFRAWMRSGVFQRIAKITTNIAHLGAGRFGQLPFPIPPLAEQREIVARAGELLIAADLSQDGFADVRQDSAHLRQSILHAAFTGRLVPQDPADEPAAALLARLRATPATPRRTRRRTPEATPA